MSIKQVLDHRLSHLKDRLIPGLDELIKVVELLREQSYTIGLVNGVYDLLHIGHCRYLEAAKKEVDILIIGVDSDELTRLRKPDDSHRPIVPQDERVEMLSHTRYADLLILRVPNEDINYLTKAVRPDVLITSSTTSDFPGEIKKTLEGYCGRIITLEAQATVSTTRRIRSLEMAGASDAIKKINEVVQRVLAEAQGDGSGDGR